jgi:hypothetical protein
MYREKWLSHCEMTYRDIAIDKQALFRTISSPSEVDTGPIGTWNYFPR